MDATHARLGQIQAEIEADRDRLARGDDPVLTPAQLAGLLDEASRLAVASRSAGLPPLTEEQQQQASAVLPLWQARLARMDRQEQMRQLHAWRQEADLVGLHLISLCSSHPDVSALAKALIDTNRHGIFTIRRVGADWRALSRQTPAQRQQAAELRREIEDARTGPPAQPAPDRRAVWGIDPVMGL